MTTKSPSHKQIIILIGVNNMERIIGQVEKHVKNIIRLLIIFGWTIKISLLLLTK